MTMNWKMLLGSVLAALAAAFGAKTYWPEASPAVTIEEIGVLQGRVSDLEDKAATLIKSLKVLESTAAPKEDAETLKARVSVIERRAGISTGAVKRTK